jgi:hypothetical protein
MSWGRYFQQSQPRQADKVMARTNKKSSHCVVQCQCQEDAKKMNRPAFDVQVTTRDSGCRYRKGHNKTNLDAQYARWSARKEPTHDSPNLMKWADMDMLVRCKPFRINGSIQDKGLTALHGKWTFAMRSKWRTSSE